MSKVSEPVTGADLPPLGWHGYVPLDPAKVEPIRQVEQHEYEAGFTKPGGGLWTTPISEFGGLTCNFWVAGHAIKYRGEGGSLVEVRPRLRDRFYVINGLTDLRAAIDRFPDPSNGVADERDPFDGDFRVDLIDYPAMAKEFAGLLLTPRGVNECNTPAGSRGRRSEVHLWGWDVPTVLFFGPFFTLGEVYEMSRDVVERWVAAREVLEQEEAVRIRQAVIDAAAAQGETFDERLLAMPAQGFLMIVAHALRDDDED